MKETFDSVIQDRLKKYHEIKERNDIELEKKYQELEKQKNVIAPKANGWDGHGV